MKSTITVTIELEKHEINRIQYNDAMIGNLQHTITDEEMESLRDDQAKIYWKISRAVHGV